MTSIKENKDSKSYCSPQLTLARIGHRASRHQSSKIFNPSFHSYLSPKHSSNSHFLRCLVMLCDNGAPVHSALRPKAQVWSCAALRFPLPLSPKTLFETTCSASSTTTHAAVKAVRRFRFTSTALRPLTVSLSVFSIAVKVFRAAAVQQLAPALISNDQKRHQSS